MVVLFREVAHGHACRRSVGAMRGGRLFTMRARAVEARLPRRSARAPITRISFHERITGVGPASSVDLWLETRLTPARAAV